MNGQGDFDASAGYIPNPRIMGRAEDDESDTIDATSNCDNQQDGGRMRRGHRHSASQIQELENFFKDNSHPTEHQRNELGQRLNLEAKQIKYWFHNKRTQMKIQRDRLDHGALREEHARLLGARDQLICRMLQNICGTATNHYPNFLSDPIHLPVSPSEPLPSSSSSSSSLMVSNPRKNATPELYMGGGTTTVTERSKFLDLAVKAMNELTMLGEKDSPLWKTDLRSKNVSLRYDTYKSVFSNVMKPLGHVVEASRDMGLVPMTCVNLVKTFMDTGKWVNVFAPIVPVASIRKVISTGSRGTNSGSLQLIQAEFQVISPLVPKRQVTFLRYCKEITPGSWVVVDVTPVQHYPNFLPYGGSNRLPSGLIIDDMGNGYSKVTWIEQAEYDERPIHQLYKPLIGSGIGLGAKRWLAMLQRYCETLSTLTSTNLTTQINPGLSAKGATELVKLAQRMNLNYYTGITGSSADKWEILQVENVAQNMRFMTRKNVNKPGEPTGIVLSAATSVWFPVNQQTLFAFLCHPSLRHEWDILTHNTSVEQTTLIRKAKRQENVISLLKIIANGMLVLQEVWNDASGAMVVYAPVETNSMEPVLRGENSDSVQLLASGFSILPDGVTESDHRGKCKIGGGCVMTLGLQILVSSNPAAELTQCSVRTAKELMVHMISKIKSTLHIET